MIAPHAGLLASLAISSAVFLGGAAPATGAAGTAALDVRAAADTIEVPRTPLEVAAVGFARAFASGSGEALGALMSPAGIRLQIDGPGGGGLPPRQAVASLLELVRRYEGGRVVVSRAEPLDGSPDRGFAEVLWSGRAAGTSDLLGLSLFLGLAREGDEWRVDEVRLLR